MNWQFDNPEIMHIQSWEGKYFAAWSPMDMVRSEFSNPTSVDVALYGSLDDTSAFTSK
jgi:hypothetical protein